MTLFAQTTIEMVTPPFWVPIAALLLPLVRQALGTVIPGADTSLRKAGLAVLLSIVVGVLSALSDGTPDTVNSVLLVIVGIAVTQLTTYQLIFKQALKNLLREDLDEITADPNTESLDIGIDGE